MIKNTILLLLCLMVDRALSFGFGGWILTPGLALLFLFHVASRQELEAFLTTGAMLVFILLATAGFFSLWVSVVYLVVLVLFHKLVKSLFADTYLMSACWIFVFSVVLGFLPMVVLDHEALVVSFFPLLGRSLWQALVLFVGAIPVFLVLDFLDEWSPFGRRLEAEL